MSKIELDAKVCPSCGSTDVEVLVSFWKNANTDQWTGNGPDNDSSPFCNKCEDHVEDLVTHEQYIDDNE